MGMIPAKFAYLGFGELRFNEGINIPLARASSMLRSLSLCSIQLTLRCPIPGLVSRPSPFATVELTVLMQRNPHVSDELYWHEVLGHSISISCLLRKFTHSSPDLSANAAREIRLSEAASAIKCTYQMPIV